MLKKILGGLSPKGGKGRANLVLPIITVVVVLGMVLSDNGGCVEINPGEVAVKYSNISNSDPEVINQQGVVTFMPIFQRVEKLDARPQIFVMEGSRDLNDNHTRKLQVRASDGSNFHFERVEIHYQLIPTEAANVIANNGPGDDYKWRALQVHTREVLRDEFGRHSFLEIADPRIYSEATSKAKLALNERLIPLGLEVTNIPPPKPSFDNSVEEAIDKRQNAEQSVEVQQQTRNKLRQEAGQRVQMVEQQKSAEYQQLIGELEARKQQAQNALIASRREADRYFIDREAAGIAYRDEKVTRARATEVTHRKQAEALQARIDAVSQQGPALLHRTIAEQVIPQLERLVARPYLSPAAPIDIRQIRGAE